MLAPILVASLLAAPALVAPVLAPGCTTAHPSTTSPAVSHAPADSSPAMGTASDTGLAELSGLGVRAGVLPVAPEGADSSRVHVLGPQPCATVALRQAQQDPFDVEVTVAARAYPATFVSAAADGGAVAAWARTPARTVTVAQAPFADAGATTTPSTIAAAAAPNSTTPSPPSAPLKAPGTTSSPGITAWQAAIVAVLVAVALVWLVGLARRRRR